MKTFYSNCLIVSLYEKFKHFNSVKCFYVKPKEKDGIPHIIWSYHNIKYHFTFENIINKKKMKWYNFILFKGVIKEFPVNKFKLNDGRYIRIL